MTPHLSAQPGDYASTVLMPGDPLRAKWIAEEFLTDVTCVNTVRNCLGYTGRYNNTPVSVQAGGMGMPSNAIYIHELYNNYGVENIVRVGSCGAIHNSINIGDRVVALSAHTDSAMTDSFENHFAPGATYSLLKRYTDLDTDAWVGPIVSSDWFYNPDAEWWRPHRDHGTLAVEMEAHILYALALKFNAGALAVCTVSDHLTKAVEPMSSRQRETGLETMIEMTLEALT